MYVRVYVRVNVLFVFSNDKFPNKEVLLSIGNILKSCQEG